MDDDECLRRPRQRHVELAQPAVAVVRHRCRLHDDDVVELEALRLPRCEDREREGVVDRERARARGLVAGFSIGEVTGSAGNSRAGTVKLTESRLGGS